MHDVEIQRVLDGEQVELEMFRKYSECYGYVFFIVRDARRQDAAPGDAG